MASLRRLFARRPRPVSVPEPEAPPAPRRSSQSRKRKRMIAVHVTPDEYAALTAKATAAGLSAGGFLRACGFGAPTPRTRTRATLTEAFAAEVIAALNRTGNNLNQIARALNSGETVTTGEIHAALRVYVEAVRVVMRTASPPATEQGGVANDR